MINFGEFENIFRLDNNSLLDVDGTDANSVTLKVCAGCIGEVCFAWWHVVAWLQWCGLPV